MRLYTLIPDEVSTRFCRSVDKQVEHDFTFQHNNCVDARGFFESRRLSQVELEVFTKDGMSVERPSIKLPDIVFWQSLMVFSNKAMSLMIELGSDPKEFWPCCFSNGYGGPFGIHLAHQCFDIIDIEKSDFGFVIPTIEPPLPVIIDRIALSSTPENLPPCFRACIPGHPLMFGDSLITDTLQQAWEEAQIEGSEFRLVYDSSWDSPGETEVECD